ncbi:hypothetical protein ANANG_G00095270 [Anguilla anguilla]|uniref:PDZ domain-containing protein n=1 Tax=Anguilla anguilla TaxID=7936 RepID=A0A9D3RYQ6_ANGAN|nr:hypothetical protein ANANG_G00095270 [Anguilla anguilla]
MRSTSMGTGDYLCITVRGGAPWGFGLRQGDELHHPLLVCQVDTRGRGALAGLREGDEVVSLNGEPCADLTLPESIDLMESSDSLQLLVKRCGVPQLLAPDSQREGFGEAEPDEEGLESTTLEVWSAGGSRAREGAGGLRVVPGRGRGRDGGGGGGTVAVVSARREGSLDLDSGGSKAELLAGSPQNSEEGGSSACVSFEISAEGAESLEERDSESERDLGRPSKHRARHARLRRSESQSEKQVKEAKSKCKRIALLLTDAPNPTNKGVLMFKRRRQRAKKYTLVSYGTGETEPEDEDEEEDYEEAEDDRAVELTLLATSESELSEDFSANAPGRGHAPGHDWDAALLEVERKVDAQGDMEQLPGTKGKGALMFARRRQRVDEIAAEHEEMRRKGIPVEGLPAEAQDVTVPKSPQVEEHSYTKASVPQPNQTFQHQQYQDQQQQQYVPTQQYPQAMNGTAHLHANDSSRSLVPNRTAKPFSGVQNRVPAPFSPSRSVASQPLPSYTEKFRVVPPPVPVNTRPQVWSPTGELIASRDERISVPAIKILPDSRKRVPQPRLKPTHPFIGQRSWNQPRVPARSAVSRPMNSYPHATKTPPAVRDGSADEGLERSAMRGRGAELFARRQARMEKFVVDAETVQANKVKPSSPTPSLPGSWKFSSNVRAPPPLSYNPILSPFYPLAAIKQPPPTSPKAKAKSAAKTQPPPKHLNAVDVMKHLPYQLNPSLFTYEAAPEVKSASPKPAPTPDSSFTYSPSPVPTPSPVPAPTLARGVSKVQPPGPALGRSCSLSLPRRLPSMSSRSDYGSPVTTPVFQPSWGPLERQASWLETGPKPPSPWEAACRSPLGLVDEAFARRGVQETVASGCGPPPSAGPSRSPPPSGGPGWPTRPGPEGAPPFGSRPGAPPAQYGPPFSSQTRATPAHCGPPFRQYQPQRSVTGYAGPGCDYRRPLSQPGYRPMYNAAWRR